VDVGKIEGDEPPLSSRDGAFEVKDTGSRVASESAFATVFCSAGLTGMLGNRYLDSLWPREATMTRPSRSSERG